MRIVFYCLGLGLLLLGVAPAHAQTVTTPAQSAPTTEPPIKAVPQTERKNKPERVADDATENPNEVRSARGSRPERRARGARGSHDMGAGRGARGARAAGVGRPTGAGRGH